MQEHTPKFIQPQFPFPKLCECGCGQCVPPSPSYGHQRKYAIGHNPNFKRPFLERFWSRIDKQSDNGCWLWRGPTDRDGYGLYQDGPKNIKVHRYSYELHKGPIPYGLLVLHKCDVASCCHPEHLFLGSQQDNIDDMIAKGRANLSRDYPGEKNPSASLTTAQVIEIRRRQATGESQYALAKIYGVTQSTISKIILRRTWKHI